MSENYRLSTPPAGSEVLRYWPSDEDYAASVARAMEDPKFRRLSELIDLRFIRPLTPEEEAESEALRGPEEDRVIGQIHDTFPVDTENEAEDDDYTVEDFEKEFGLGPSEQ